MTHMKLNHINLTVNNVLETRDFLSKYFGLTEMQGAPMTEKFGLMTDPNGMVISLMTQGSAGDVTYPSAFHIGFVQDSQEKVNEINQRMKDDGLDVPAPRSFHGSWTYYVKAPGGFLVEVQSFLG